MPYSFAITGRSPEEILKKLKEEHPHEWRDVIAMPPVQVERRGLMRFFGKPQWKQHFIIVSRLDPKKGRKIDELRRWLMVKAGRAEAEAAEPREGVVRRIEDVRRAVAMLERPDFPASILPPPKEEVVPAGSDAASARWCKVLEEAEVPVGAAAELAKAVVERGGLEAALEGFVRFRGPVRLAEGERKVVVLVGPTGVGKTTTLVKVCAEFYRRRIPLRFMTVDTFRVGATAQLEAYAEIIKAPIDIVRTPREYAERLAACGERMVFTDTAGRNPRDEVRRRELMEFLKAVPSGFVTEVYLVVSATTALQDMLAVAKRFGELPLAGVVVTKTDEVDRQGRVVEFLRRSGLALAYLTTGQEVPDDLAEGSAGVLAGMLVPPEARP